MFWRSRIHIGEQAAMRAEGLYPDVIDTDQLSHRVTDLPFGVVRSMIMGTASEETTQHSQLGDAA